MILRIKSFLVIASIIYSNQIFAQKPPKKFGDIDKANLEMSVYEKDTNAAAVILFEWGETEVQYQSGSLVIVYRLHKRIKILDSEGFDEADVTIPFHRKGPVTSLKASTYNLQNGKVVISKVDKKSTFTEKVSEYVGNYKFSFPDVKEGSILEYTYYKRLGSYTRLNTWYFQEDYPVVYSEYNVIIPDWFKYQELLTGYIPLASVTKKDKSISTGGGTLNGQHYQYIAKDVPAFKSEPFLNSRRNYVSKIDFELVYINIPGSVFEEVMGSYTTAHKVFLDDEDFGSRLKTSNYYSEFASGIVGDKNGLEGAQAIYDYVSNEIKWNDKITKWSFVNPRKVIEDKEGSSADINLLMITLLRNAGYNADPVVYSTRSNGLANPYYAILTRFNDVLACVTIDDTRYLLDGTDSNAPFNMIPFRSLNGQGLLLKGNGTEWVDLKGIGHNSVGYSGDFKLDVDGYLSGNLTTTKKGYDALAFRKRIQNDGKEQYFEKMREDETDWEIGEYSIDGIESIAEPTVESVDLEIGGEAEGLGNIIYINPIFAGKLDSNPFKLENREYPVDYGCKQSWVWYFTITIPEGYYIDELPKPSAIGLPNKSGSFQYSVSQQDSKIQIVSRMNISNNFFLPDQYHALKQFYSMIVEKQSESIVLKKNT